jgi:hypothetical protein
MRWLSLLTLAPPLLSDACHLDEDVVLGSDFDPEAGLHAGGGPSGVGGSTGSAAGPSDLGAGGSACDTSDPCDAGPDGAPDGAGGTVLVIRPK